MPALPAIECPRYQRIVSTVAALQAPVLNHGARRQAEPMSLEWLLAHDEVPLSMQGNLIVPLMRSYLIRHLVQRPAKPPVAPLPRSNQLDLAPLC